MRFGLFLVLCSLAALPLQGADRIIGAVTPDGGALLVKRFAVSAGSTIAGITFVSNDLGTVFPKVTVLRGPAATISAAEQLVEFTEVQASGSHHITLGFSPLHLEATTDLYVAVTMPPSNGVVEYGEGAGIPATQLETPAGSYFASGLEADLGPMDVDYDVQLIFDQQPGKANAASVEPQQARPTTFLRAGVPNPTSGMTVVQFGIDIAAATELAVYDVAGRKLRVLAHERLGPGMHVRDWDGRDDQGRQVAAGIYLVRLVAAEKMLLQKIVMTK